VIDPAGKGVGAEVVVGSVVTGAFVETGVGLAVPHAANAKLATAANTNKILIERFILFISPFLY